MESNFNTQMTERGNTCFNFFIDKTALNEIKEDEVIEESLMPSGIAFSSDFGPDDMMNAILGYMNATMSKKSKLAFVTQLHNYILSDIIDEDRYDEDDGSLI